MIFLLCVAAMLMTASTTTLKCLKCFSSCVRLSYIIVWGDNGMCM